MGVGKAVVAQDQRERNKRNTQTYSRDTEQALCVLICVDDGGADGGSPGVLGDDSEWRAVHESSQSLVSEGCEGLAELPGEDLCPDRAGNGVTEGAANAVGGEVETGNGSEVCGAIELIVWKQVKCSGTYARAW